MKPSSHLSSHRPDRTDVRAPQYSAHLSTFYKDIDGCFITMASGSSSVRASVRPLSARQRPAEEQEVYLAPSGHCHHSPAPPLCHKEG